MTSVVKAGYAVYGVGDRAKPNAPVRQWHTRYLVLTGTCICVYPDLNSTNKPLACAVIIPDTKAEVLTEQTGATTKTAGAGAEFRVFVKDPTGSNFIFVLPSSREQMQWVDAIRRSIRLSRFALKAYITAVQRKGILNSKSRKYFVLDNNVLYRHKDYDKVWEVEAKFKFDLSTRTIYNDDTNTIKLRNSSSAEGSLELCFEDNSENYLQWKDIIAKMVTASEEAVDKIRSAIEGALKVSDMYFRFDTHGGKAEWRECNVILSASSIILQEVGHKGDSLSSMATTASPLSPGEDSAPVQARFDPSQCIEILDFSPDSICTETSSSLCTFAVTNRGKRLVLRESSSHNMRTWIKVVLRCISRCGAKKRDDILSYGVRLIKENVFYSITLSRVGPLGFELEATEDGWVLVKSASADSGVSKGSVLTSVQRQNVLLMPAADTLKLLVDWTPPLTLHFRKPSEKSGYLYEKSVGAMGSKWRKRYFRMFCGQLERHDDHHSVATDAYPLAGAAAFELSDDDSATQRILCFRFVSGDNSLLLQAESSDELLSWMGYLCHGIAVASGGSFVRRVEQARVSRLTSMKQKGAVYKRQSTIGLLSTAVSNEFAPDDESVGSVHDPLHDEEQWWWAMGGNSEDLGEINADRRSYDGSGSDSSSFSRAKDLLDVDGFGRQSNSGLLVASAPRDITSENTKRRKEQERLQMQLCKLEGDKEASKEVVLETLRNALREAEKGSSETDLASLEAAVSVAELWALTGPDMDRAAKLISNKKKPIVHAIPQRRKSKSVLVPRSAAGIAAAQHHVSAVCSDHPVHSPTNEAYEWSDELKTTVENAISKGTYECSDSILHTKVFDWKGRDADAATRRPVGMQCIADSRVEDNDPSCTLFAVDSSVQIYLNHIFIRELKLEGGQKMLLDKDGIGLLVSNYDHIAVCDAGDHHSVLMRVSLHASEDVAKIRIPGEPSPSGSCNDEQKNGRSSILSSSDTGSSNMMLASELAGPIVKWVGRYDGELFNNTRAVLSAYVMKCQKLMDMRRAAHVDATVEGVGPLQLHQSFSAQPDNTVLEKVDYANLHLKSAAEGRLEIEIQCNSRLERDSLYLSILYLVSPAKTNTNSEYPLIPRDMNLRDRVRCLPWAVEAAFRSKPSGRLSTSLKEQQLEEEIRLLKNELVTLKEAHEKDLKSKNAEIRALKDQLTGGAVDIL